MSFHGGSDNFIPAGCLVAGLCNLEHASAAAGEPSLQQRLHEVGEVGFVAPGAKAFTGCGDALPF